MPKISDIPNDAERLGVWIIRLTEKADNPLPPPPTRDVQREETETCPTHERKHP